LKKIPKYLIATKELQIAPDDKALDTMAGQRMLIGLPLGRWMKAVKDRALNLGIRSVARARGVA
jgi:hypothetical protein